jgi:predicted N-acetyltransferase YhbS
MLTIRPSTEHDAPAIAALVNAAFHVERRFKNGDRTNVAEIEAMMHDATFLVGEEAGQIVASVFVKVNGTRGYFGMLSVDPARQRGGLGRQMREAAERFCREHGCTEMTLRTISLREELPPYYERFGYRVTGTEPVPTGIPFTQPVHFVTMAKPL